MTRRRCPTHSTAPCMHGLFHWEHEHVPAKSPDGNLAKRVYATSPMAAYIFVKRTPTRRRPLALRRIVLCMTKAKRALLPPHSKQSATAANLASLSRIRALVTSDEGGLQSQAGQDGGEVDRAARRGSSPPDAITIFKGVRILLEQNAGDQPGTEEVGACFSSI